ncbi:MAG TPA: NAD(P)-dependent oxidoreductase [Solirubrobacteraceae bacterium]|jgi:nucleoside-diphosphate-sugar epimerase|nr:NAD(P)-dependent oxidoreductase [Solirubrobacteraceae bacterium]
MRHLSEATLITGGSGYIGAMLVKELLQDGREVRVLDSLLHGQEDIAAEQERAGAQVFRADIRDAEARRQALAGAHAVVHLAAIVGDPACALDPAASDDVNVQATRALVADANDAGVQRLVFASTCSNYGRMADPDVPIAEDGELRPVSLYAEQKVGMEQLILAGAKTGTLTTQPTCLRFATVYGVGRRMRFDLTVNEFTRELWADRELEVFGEQFWRPYIHVRDAARAVHTVLQAPVEQVAGEVFNAGRSGENYRKLDLVQEIGKQIDRGTVSYVHRDEDPRDYKVSFDKIRAALHFQTLMTVPDGIAEVIAALDAKAFGDPFDGRYRNVP